MNDKKQPTINHLEAYQEIARSLKAQSRGSRGAKREREGKRKQKSR